MKNVGTISILSRRMTLPTFFMFFCTSLLLLACKGDSNQVDIEGRMLHMNQAEFYVYSIDGVIDDIDTIHVQGGRFEYSKPIMKAGTLVIVFPNYSQIPLFVEPGMSLDIEGDAQHLKQLEVSGSDDNEVFTQWRKDNDNNSHAAQEKNAAEFIKNNPGSPVSLWLLRQYYVMDDTPDTSGALKLLDNMLKAQPGNLAIKKLQSQLVLAEDFSVNGRIGSFTATDINGKHVNGGLLLKGNSIVMTMASWNFDSQNMLRRVISRKRGEINVGGVNTPIDNVVVVSLDADKKETQRMVRDCNADNVIVICDGKQFDSPLMKALRLSTVPDNIVLKDGRIIKRRVPTDKL